MNDFSLFLMMMNLHDKQFEFARGACPNLMGQEKTHPKVASMPSIISISKLTKTLLSRPPADFVSLLGLPLQAPIVSDPSNVATCTNRRSSKPYCSSAGYVLGDQVGNCGRSRADMEGHYTLYHLPVRRRPTCVLAQVFGP